MIAANYPRSIFSVIVGFVMDAKTIGVGFLAGIAGGMLAAVLIVRLNLKLGADK